MTQHEKIIAVIKTDPLRWWLPGDFMKPELGDLFVGWEASARLSELAKMNMLDTKQEGKFKARRLKANRPINVTDAKPTEN